MAWPVLIHHQTQAAGKMLECTAASLTAPQKENSRNRQFRESIVPTGRPLLLGGELLCGNRTGRAVLIRVLDLRPKGPRLILLALGNVEVGQSELRHCG